MQTNNMNLVDQYIAAYNNFDIDTMISLFAADCVFEDISNSRGITRCNGKEELKKMALASKHYFSQREQKIVNFVIGDNKIALEIEYHAILAQDFPNGMKKGDSLALRGVSIFEFEENKITRLADFS